MKVIFEKEELLKGLNVVQIAISSKTTLPILTNFLMETEEEKIKLSATDLEIGVSCQIKGKVAKKGVITLPTRRLIEIVRELPSEKIELSVDEKNRISIRSGRARFLVMGLPKEEFPVLPQPKKEKSFKVEKATLEEMLEKTSFAMSQDETRYMLNGIFLVNENNQLKAVATDGRRLAYIIRQAEGEKVSLEVIIPAKTVFGLVHLLKSAKVEEKVEVNVGENIITFSFDDIVFLSRLIEGEYPNYQEVIPQKEKIKLKVNTKELLQVTKRVALLCTGQGTSIKYTLQEKGLLLSANTPGVGEAEEMIALDYQGEKIEIAFNPAYLLAALKAIDAEELFLRLSTALTPVMIQPVNDQNYLCLIMPMRLA